ncbi:hypothetical protein HYPSUDRAFT_638112 [Hypholoma sublateritium FD-334 SS-4]|uniref:G protein-coupled receptor n=1 Tax=Hypholoma sublateritium (strain FD-334 SS-4) TaxID=945553 RepID=A0A0D2NVD7_HYPSF|nr:hypothetical protein HYPSUDRAFT_638112 [Hypholoma sublateritium FD-334 SS-4]
MSFPNVTGSLPNQLTPPLGPLESEGAYRLEITVANYAAVASLAILVRDILDNIVSDYRFLKEGLNVPLFAYFTSRVGVMGYLLGSVIFSSVPIGHCTLFDNIALSCSSVAFSCTALLFFLRLRAVYNQNPVVVATFFALWLVFPVVSILLPLVLPASRRVFAFAVEGTNTCASALSDASPVFYLQATELAYDTLVFIAISRRLCRIAYVKPSGPQESLKIWIFGKYLPAFTKSLYLDGQVYYLTTLLGGTVVFVLILVPGIPIFLQLAWLSPNVALVNIMACRVYRRTRMGMIRESEISTSAIGRAIPLAVTHPILFNNNSTSTSSTS